MTLQTHHASNSPLPDGFVTGWLVAVRGATSVEVDTPEAIQAAMHALMHQLAERNGWFEKNSPCRVIALWISVTADLQSRSPASALRSALPASRIWPKAVRWPICMHPTPCP